MNNKSSRPSSADHQGGSSAEAENEGTASLRGWMPQVPGMTFYGFACSTTVAEPVRGLRQPVDKPIDHQKVKKSLGLFAMRAFPSMQKLLFRRKKNINLP
jgi:hypothetical protein